MNDQRTVIHPVDYRGMTIYYNPAPIPGGPLWSWEHPDYDGAPDSGDDRAGDGLTIQECEEQIDELLTNEGASMQGDES